MALQDMRIQMIGHSKMRIGMRVEDLKVLSVLLAHAQTGSEIALHDSGEGCVMEICALTADEASHVGNKLSIKKI